MLSQEELEKRFSYHTPSSEKASLHELVQHGCGSLAKMLNEILPDSREKSLAFTKLEEAMMWANAAIARNPVQEEPEE